MQSVASGETIQFELNRGATVRLFTPVSSDYVLPFKSTELVEAERAALNGFTSLQRRREYITSRSFFHRHWNASHALVTDSDGVPTWPANFCGALTHKNGGVAMVCEPTNSWRSFGLDLEEILSKTLNFESKICVAEEQSHLESWAANAKIDRETVLTAIFSAKEALFKLLFPLTRKRFYFHDAVACKLAASSDSEGLSVSLQLVKTLDEEFACGFSVEVRCQTVSVDSKSYVLAVASLQS